MEGSYRTAFEELINWTELSIGACPENYLPVDKYDYECHLCINHFPECMSRQYDKEQSKECWRRYFLDEADKDKEKEISL